MTEKIQSLVGELERVTRREEDCLALIEKMKQDHSAEQVHDSQSTIPPMMSCYCLM